MVGVVSDALDGLDELGPLDRSVQTDARAKPARHDGRRRKRRLSCAATKDVMRNVDALNSGYASQLLEEYLENPESVPSEWRALF